MKARTPLLLALRMVIIACLVAIAIQASLEASARGGRTFPFFIPALVALVPTVLALELLPRLRPLVGIGWVVVFDLVVLGLIVATLGETTDPARLAFLFLALVIATSRDLLAGVLAGGMAAAGLTYLLVRHGHAQGLLDPLATAQATVLLAAGLFTGLLSREAEKEREVRAAQTAELRQELAQLGDHLKNVLSCVASGVLAVDEHGRATTYNRAAERILGLPEHKVLGRRPADVPELADLAPILTTAERAADAPRHELEVRRPDGTRVRIGYARTPLENVAGRHLGEILVFQDVTLIRDYEARLVRQEQLAALGRMMSGIAHEFGNILGGARGLADLALQGGPTEARDVLPVVRDTLSRALLTVENLLRFARGTPLLRVPGVDLREVVERCLLLVRAEAEKAGVTLERAYAHGGRGGPFVAQGGRGGPPDPSYAHGGRGGPPEPPGADTPGSQAPPPVHGDPSQLEQAFLNIAINAVHAVDGRERRVVRVGLASRAPASIEVTFEDTGEGVPPALRERIFEPFFTTKGPLGGSTVPGTGLGLSIALGIISAHQGTIDVDSSPALGGARFTINLPIAPASEAPPLNVR